MDKIANNSIVDTQKVIGLITIDVKDKFGRLKEHREIKNIVCNTGKAVVAGLLCGDGGLAVFNYLEVGVGTTAAAAADTALQTAITDSGLARASATVSRVTTTVTNDTAQLVKTWSVSGTKAITEAGAFNASSAGTILGHQVFSAVNVVSGDTFQLTYKFQIT